MPALALRLAILAAALAPVLASAQIDVTMTPEKPAFVAHEPVRVQLTMVNRSGRDVKLSGPNAFTSWLNFLVRDSRQNLVVARPGGPKAGPINLPNGKPVSVRIDLNQAYPLDRFGHYSVTANVYDPSSNDWTGSASQRVTIDEAKPIWTRIAGKGSGRREYSILTYRALDRTSIYFRLRDADTGVVERTYELGTMIQYKSPQAELDSSGKCHVLYMTAPRQYRHYIIKTDGKVDHFEDFTESKGETPTLVMAGGSVSVQGGQSEQAEKNEKRDKLKQLSRIRNISERPLGY